MSVDIATDSGAPDRPQNGLPVSVIAWSAAAFGAALLFVCLTLVARGQDAGDRRFIFELYAGDRPAPGTAAVMRPKVAAGPFPSLAICYAAGALGVEAVSNAHHDKVFMGRCEGHALLTGREIANRALELLPRDQPTEKNR